MDAGDLKRATWRVAHEILERNRSTSNVVLVGLQTGGVWWAESLARAVGAAAGEPPLPVGSLDVAYYRDDIGLRPVVPSAPTDVPFPVDGAVVVLCDDVLFTGRTVRAALNAIADLGRPAAVQLAVVVDRGHRELPVRPDYVGKNLPTRRDEMVDVTPEGVVIGELDAGAGGGPGPGSALPQLNALASKGAPAPGASTPPPGGTLVPKDAMSAGNTGGAS